MGLVPQPLLEGNGQLGREQIGGRRGAIRPQLHFYESQAFLGMASCMLAIVVMQ